MMNRIRASSVLVAILPVVAACTDDPEQSPAQGGAVALTFAGNSGSNLDTSPLPPSYVAVVFRDAASQTRVIGVFADEPADNGFRRKVWQLGLSIMGDPVAGATYAIGSTATLEYEQFPTPGSWLSWDASGGSVHVESVSGTSATLSFSSIAMAPNTGGSGNEATGTFTFSGTVTVDNIDP